MTDGNRLERLVTLRQIKAVPQERWTKVLRLYESQDVNHGLVLKNRSLLGMITRERLLRVLSAHVELGERRTERASLRPALEV